MKHTALTVGKLLHALSAEQRRDAQAFAKELDKVSGGTAPAAKGAKSNARSIAMKKKWAERRAAKAAAVAAKEKAKAEKKKAATIKGKPAVEAPAEAAS